MKSGNEVFGDESSLEIMSGPTQRTTQSERFLREVITISRLENTSENGLLIYYSTRRNHKAYAWYDVV